MTDLNSIIEINISRETTPVARASFSIPCFISAHTRFSERARVYNSLDGVAEDFASTSTAYIAASKLFGQEITPEQIVIGRRQVDEVVGSIATVANSTVYSVTINGTLVSATSDSSATAIEICAALKTAFTAASISGVTFTDNLDGTFEVANSTAGTALTVKSSANITLANTAPTETWADTIAAVRGANDNWYGLTTESHVDADIQAIAAYIEAQKKIYGASTSSSDAKGSGTTDIGSVLKALGYVRTFLMYSANANTQYPECALMGLMLPEVPGSADWTYKQLTGVSADVLTATEVTNLHNKNYTTYESVGGVSATVGGNMVGGEKIDIIIGVDWTEARMRENIWFRMVNAKKIPYTAAGTTIIETEIRRVLSEGIRNGLYADNPAPVVIMPAVLSQDANDRAARIYRGITFEARLAGSIRFVKIVGRVTV